MTDTKQLDLALLECQRDIKPIHNNSKGNFGSYADYEQIMYFVRPAMLKQGLKIEHKRADTDEHLYLITTIKHTASGQATEDKARVIPDKPGCGSLGAALTYAKRFSVCLLLGIVTTDYDNVDSGTHEEVIVQAQPVATKVETISPDEYRMLHKVLDGYPAEKATKILSFYKIDKWSLLPKPAFGEVYQGIEAYHKNMASAGKPSSHV